MAKKKRKKQFKSKVRIFFILIIFVIVAGTLGYNCVSNIIKIQRLNNEKESLEKKIVVLQEEKKELETDILKLNDPDYIAKYVREKYFYSKDGELILRLDK